MNAEQDTYAFWDLIAQEAYKTQIAELGTRTWDIFEANEQGKRVWLFACNEASRKVIENYGDIWNITGVLDNSQAMQGKSFEGLNVYSPADIAGTLSEERDVVILSLRLNSDIVYRQLIGMGFTNIYSLGVMLSGIEPYHLFVKEIEGIIDKAETSDIVLMESMNDFDGNTGALYEYLKKNDSQHQFVWICKNEEADSASFDNKDKKLISRRSVEDLKEYIRLRARAKWEIWECDPIRKVRDDQINVFLQHYGMGYKQVAHLYNSPDYVDYVLTTNAFVYEFEKKSITYAEKSEFIYGELPRNDVLYGDKWDELSKITSRKYRKTVLWAPTLRESRYYQRIDSDISYPFGVSLIYSDADMKLLDAYLAKLDMLLILKPHPRQKLNYTDKDYGNILYLTGERARAAHPYKLLTQIDAMITDYSSIVFDYMLLDRPCAWVLEDREHYKIEYLMDDPETYMPGNKIYTMEDLFDFLSDVSDGKDPYCEERRRICSLCNPPFEGKGCERLAEVLGL